ncbi:hypothetical protein HanIR_Chr11g0530931 [Helianthus annuus]|nr:hypothetical protein HanIR_Chr11g0530931 [Helianthus annuus]
MLYHYHYFHMLFAYYHSLILPLLVVDLIMPIITMLIVDLTINLAILHFLTVRPYYKFLTTFSMIVIQSHLLQ